MDVDAVETYSGSTYAERPSAFIWEGRRMAVVELLSRWRTPEGRAFRVRTAEGAIFELFYHEPEDQWSILKVSSSPLNPD